MSAINKLLLPFIKKKLEPQVIKRTADTDKIFLFIVLIAKVVHIAEKESTPRISSYGLIFEYRHAFYSLVFQLATDI